MVRLLKDGGVTEDSINKTIIKWVNSHPSLRGLVIHFPNEGSRTSRYGKNLRDKGMRKGVSDLMIAIPNHGFGGAWIELKSESGVIKKEQKEFLEDMRLQNYFTAVTWSIDETISVIGWYCINSTWNYYSSFPCTNKFRTDIQKSTGAPLGLNI